MKELFVGVVSFVAELKEKLSRIEGLAGPAVGKNCIGGRLKRSFSASLLVNMRTSSLFDLTVKTDDAQTMLRLNTCQPFLLMYKPS